MESKRLPNRVTTNIELEEWSRKHIPGFVGVIDRSQFADRYKKMVGGDSMIVNLDPGYSRGGTHWVAIRVSSEAPIVFYKDSFGAPPPTDVVNAVAGEKNIYVGKGIAHVSRGLIYGNKMYQNLREENCGRRAAEFLYAMSTAASRMRELEEFRASE